MAIAGSSCMLHWYCKRGLRSSDITQYFHYYTPSAIHNNRSPPRAVVVTRTDTVMDFLLHDRSIVMHADTTTPVGMTDAFLTLFPVIVGLPRYCGVSAPSTAFRWLLSVHSRYGPHNPLTSEEVVSGRDSALLLPPRPLLVLPVGARVSRGGLSPTERSCISRHTQQYLRGAIRPVVMGRKLVVRWFTGGRERAAQIMSLLGTAVWSHMLG